VSPGRTVPGGCCGRFKRGPRIQHEFYGVPRAESRPGCGPLALRET